MLRCLPSLLVPCLLAACLVAGGTATAGERSAGGERAASVGQGTKARPGPVLRRIVFTHPTASGQAACARKAEGGPAHCRTATAHPSSRRWARGLPPALGVQARDCPAGTMATLARGHDDIVRCLPM